MLPYVGIVVCLIALHAGVGGVAALRWGWLMPWQRRYVLRLRPYGWANLTVAAGLLVYWFGGVLPGNTTIRDGAIVVAGLALLETMRAQGAPRDRRKPGGHDING